MPPPGSARCLRPSPARRPGPRSAVRHVEGLTKYPPVGFDHVRDAQAVQLRGQRGIHRGELRSEDLAVLDHVVTHTLRRAEELDVPQLVDLVRPDRGELLVPQVGRRRSRGDAARNATPAPAYVILLVDANMIGRLRVPGGRGQERMSTPTSPRRRSGGGSAYALSQKILKSGAAVGIAPAGSRPPADHGPAGLAYVGTIHMPLIDGSSRTRASIAATSGPSASIGTLTISMP
jgi:hypothetical protein